MSITAKKTAVMILAFAMLCFTALAALFVKGVRAEPLTANAANLFTLSGEDASDWQVEYNVAGSDKHADLTNDTRKGVHFQTANTGAAANNASVTLNSTLSGLFEIDFRAYTTETDTSSGGTIVNSPFGAPGEEFRTFAITITDEDTGEMFTIYISSGQSWMRVNPTVRVAYGDATSEIKGVGLKYIDDMNNYNYTDDRCYGGDALQGGNRDSSLVAEGYGQDTMLPGTSFVNRTFNNSKSWADTDAGWSTYIGFDPITKQVYGYVYCQGDFTFHKREIIDLDNPVDIEYLTATANSDGNPVKGAMVPESFRNSTFTNYSVKMSVQGVVDGMMPKFIIYSINGQSLAGEDGVLTENVAPGLGVDMPKEAKTWETFAIPTPTMHSVLGGTPAFAGNIKVKGPEGTILEEQAFSEGLKFIPEVAGTYTITYSNILGPDGNVRRALSDKNGVYEGEEIVYTYAVEITKGLQPTGSAEDLIIENNGMTVTYNVSGSEKQADLTRDTRKGIHFQTAATGADANGSSITLGGAENGLLTGLFELNFRAYTVQTDAAEDWWDGGNWYDRADVEEFRTFAITIQDADTDEMFTVYINGGTSWVIMTPNARVAYGDVGAYYGTGYWYANGTGTTNFKNGEDKGLSSTEYNTALPGTTFMNRARNTDWVSGGGYTTNIGFDPVTKEVYGYAYDTAAGYECYKRVILDLDDPEDMEWLTKDSAGNKGAAVSADFQNSTFQNYTVKLSVLDVTEGAAAKFIVYDLNGQSLAGENGQLASNAGYGMYAPAQEGFVGMKDALPEPYVSSVLTGETAFTGTVKVLGPGGETILEEQAYSDTLTFTPTEAGTYTIVYGGMQDENERRRLQYTREGYTGEEYLLTVPYTVKEDALVLPEYDYVMREMSVSVAAVPQGAGLTVTLTIQKDGSVYDNQENVENTDQSSYAFAEDGEYTLIYTAANAAGGTQTAQTTFTVIGMRGTIVTPDSAAVVGADSIWDKDDFSVQYCDEGTITDYVLSAEVYNGTQWQAVAASEDGSINLKDTFAALKSGDWTVRFTAAKGGDSVQMEREFTVSDGTPPVIEADELGTGFISVPDEDTNTVKYFAVLTGTQSVIPSATVTDDVYSGDDLTLTVLLKKPTDSEASAVNPGDTLTFDVVGTYTIVYTAVDAEDNRSTFTYIIEAKDLWLEVTAPNAQAELGDVFTPAAATVVNGFSGEAVTDFTIDVKLYFSETEVQKTGEGFLPPYAGTYSVEYTVSYGGATKVCTATLTVSDTVKPVVSVQGEYANTAKIGDTITVLSATAADKGSYSMDIVVMLDGTTKISIGSDNTFKIEKAGTYTIRYVATDASGNASDPVEFTITVEEPEAGGGCSGGVVSGVGALAVIVIAGACAIIVRRKNNVK